MLEMEALSPPEEEELERTLIRIPVEQGAKVIRLSDPLIRNQLRPLMAPWFSI